MCPNVMTTVRQAKRSLGRELRDVEGFMGVGVGDGEIRVYAVAADAPVVSVLKRRWGDTYEGFPISVVLSLGFHAQRAESGHAAG